jgi:hypothetical protein
VSDPSSSDDLEEGRLILLVNHLGQIEAEKAEEFLLA